MSNHIHNSIAFFCDDNRLTEILEAIQRDNDGTNLEHGIGTIDFNKIIPDSDFDSHYDAWNTSCNALYCSYDGKHTICFRTNNCPVYPIVEKLAEMFKDIKIVYVWTGDYYTGYCGAVKYENGDMISFVRYQYMDVTIDVPPELGYLGNQFSLVFAPEMFGIDRNDKAAIEAYVMKSAVESAEQLADKYNS